MVKAVTIFLIVIIVLAMFGKLGWLGALAPKGLRKPRQKTAQKTVTCTSCGRHIIGTTGCGTVGCDGDIKTNPKG
ncbi:hypothetical protein [Pseudorhodobacter antarcticus]|uniref:hypothetical protein n=1 Tax=Pseudorhodobacter antarcticus TaxID=1077947 RepID=UPI000B004F5A|nr:hypothetical protein [Pseudorhodobacter antarcticus]